MLQAATASHIARHKSLLYPIVQTLQAATVSHKLHSETSHTTKFHSNNIISQVYSNHRSQFFFIFFLAFQEADSFNRGSSSHKEGHTPIAKASKGIAKQLTTSEGQPLKRPMGCSHNSITIQFPPAKRATSEA